MVLGMKAYTNSDSYTYFSVPSSGILRNVNMKVFSTIDTHWSIEVGQISNANTSNLPVASNTAVVVKGKSSADYWRVDSIDFESPDTNLRGMYYIHRPGIMRLRKDTQYQLATHTEAGNSTVIVIIQGEFVPYDNADYSYTMFFDDADNVGRNYGRLFMVPDNLRDIYVEYIATCSEATAQESGIIHVRALRAEDIPVPVANITGEGLQDGAYTNTGDVIYGGQTHDILVNSAAQGLAVTKGSFVVKDIMKSGDGFAFDMTQLVGTLSDVLLEMKIHGKAWRSGKSRYKTQFMDGNLLEQPIAVGGRNT
jgi:hypothetical protein